MKKTIIFTVAILMLTVSCKKESFFELERPPQTPWGNLTEFERSIIGAYSICFDTPGGWQNSWVVAKLFKNTAADDIANTAPAIIPGDGIVILKISTNRFIMPHFHYIIKRLPYVTMH